MIKGPNTRHDCDDGGDCRGVVALHVPEAFVAVMSRNAYFDWISFARKLKRAEGAASVEAFGDMIGLEGRWQAHSNL